jgi:hypothetical protein
MKENVFPARFYPESQYQGSKSRKSAGIVQIYEFVKV